MIQSALRKILSFAPVQDALAEAGFNPRKKKNHLKLVIKDKYGNVKNVLETTNIRTNVGIDFVADALGNSGGQPAAADYIAVSNDAGAPAPADTTLTGELAVDGLERAQGTYSHTPAATSYTIEHTFSVTGGPHTVQKAALLNAAVAGDMAFEALFGSSATVTTSDTLTVTWTINI